MRLYIANKFILDHTYTRTHTHTVVRSMVTNRVTRSVFWTSCLGHGHKSAQYAVDRSRSVIVSASVMNINLRLPDYSRFITSNLLYSHLPRSGSRDVQTLILTMSG